MEKEQEFRRALADKKMAPVVLDQKWHRLFAVHGKTNEIKALEKEINLLLARQGKLNNHLKDLKRLKGQLLDGIVQNMDNSNESGNEKTREKKLEENKRLIDEVNRKLEECEDELIDIPYKIHSANDELMILSMEYFYEKIRVNRDKSSELEEWINQTRVELKRNIIRKQNCDINNREMYAYLHDVFGAAVIDLFDIRFEDREAEKEAKS
uniref:hypothetical protein n=1 Tax=Agathobacter sp. TaxID=2021311 RepID=UPI0040560ACF